MKFFNTTLPLFSLFLFSFALSFAEEISTKGALIIASVEGQVTVVNNDTQKPLDGSKVVAGGVIYDGHTVKTGSASKMVLLLTNGTIATIKAESSLNIKKFTQEKFDMSKTNLSELKGEPSKSNVVIDIEIGDMVVDVKKLDKQSSFNIESPVGTAGIRGTVPAISVMQMPDGGFQQKTAMLRGEIAFTPRGGGLPTLLGPGQSLASGIGPNGVMLPMQLGQVSQAMMSAIQADVEAAGAAMGITPESGPDGSDATVPDADEPTEDELNESDDERKGASKGLGDDDNGTEEAVALEKAGLIDLDDPEQLSKADTYVEVTGVAANKLEERAEQRRLGRRNAGAKDDDAFLSDITSNLGDVVTVTEEMDALGIKSTDLLEQTLESAENAPITNSNLNKVRSVGVSDPDALAGLVSSPDKSDDAAEILADAETLGSNDPETFAALARSTDVADKMKEAKDSGTDVDSVLVAVKTTDSKKQVAKQQKVEAELKKQEALSSGVVIPSNLISRIDAASDEATLESILNENIKSDYYDQLVILKESRSQILTAEAATVAAESAKTKIVDTSAYVGKVKEISAKKLQEANEQKKGLPNDIVIAIESALTIDSTEDEITTLKATYADHPDKDAILIFVDKLKSSFDLSPAKMASGIVDNADTAADNVETIKTFEKLGSDPAAVASKPSKAKDYKESIELVYGDIENLSSDDVAVLDNLDNVTDFIVSVKSSENGVDASKSIVNLVKTADANDQESGDDFFSTMNELATQDGGLDVINSINQATEVRKKDAAEGEKIDASFFDPTNMKNMGTSIKKAKDLGVEDEALILELAKNPDKAAKVNEAFDELGENVDADGAKNLLGNVEQIDDTLTAIGHAKKSGADLKEFVKKDVEEHKALNNVVEKLGDSADKFLEEGIEDALQLNQAIEEGHVDADTLASSVSSGQSFSDAFKNSSVAKLNERFAGNDDFLEAVSLYEDQAKDILFALSFVDPGSSQELALMGNLDKLGAIMYLSHRFEDNPQRMNVIYSNLDVAIALDQLVAELGVFPTRLNLVFENAELAPAILATYQEYELTGAYDLIDLMFSSSQNLRDTISNDGLNKLLSNFPQFAVEIENNRDRAGEINNLITQVGQQYAPQILENLDKFDDLHVMVLRTKGDPARIDTLFLHVEGLVEIRKISDHYKNTNVLGGQDVIFSNLELFAQDQAYYDLAFESPKYFVRLSEIAGDLQDVPSALALQLKELDLNREELKTVLNDLLSGPQVDGPSSSPPEQDGNQVSADTSTLSFLLDHVIPSQDDENVDGEVYLNPNKVVSYETASSSSFFSESADLYFMLSDLETTDAYQGTADTGSLQDAGYFVGGVFGGRNIEFNSATYNLSNLASENLLIAASGKLSLNGEIDIIAKSVEGSSAELIFMSLEQLTIQDGSSVNYHGDTLGFGSLESINVVNVDLFAEGEISLRSLDNLVINNSDMATSGNGGADFVHLLAASELAIDNLRFSEHVRQIAMEAMTINLSNLNFPAGSTVQLNSLYGGVDGKYPTFDGKEYGRVNFIQNVRYNQNLMNSRSTFDQFGGAISIGSIK